MATPIAGLVIPVEEAGAAGADTRTRLGGGQVGTGLLFASMSSLAMLSQYGMVHTQRVRRDSVINKYTGLVHHGLKGQRF